MTTRTHSHRTEPHPAPARPPAPPRWEEGKRKKEERKRTSQGRDGRTARRHHTGILKRGVWCASREAVAHPWASTSSYLSSQSLSDSRCNLRATSRSPPSRRALPCRFFLCRVALPSASFCDAAAACRSLVLAASFAFRRSSALLAAYPGPSRLSSSPRARTSLLTPSHCYHLPPGHIIAQVHSLFEHLCLHG